MRKVLTGYKIVLWYRFRQKGDRKSLRCDIFGLLPLKFISISFVKRFIKTLCMKSSEFRDFSDWKHVRTTATCKKKIFFIKNVPENHVLLFSYDRFCHDSLIWYTWCLDSLLPDPSSHTERVLSPVHGDTQRPHNVTHGFTRVQQCSALSWQLGRPHPVTAALHILRQEVWLKLTCCDLKGHRHDWWSLFTISFYPKFYTSAEWCHL